MANLSAKFDALTQVLINQHATMMVALSGISLKLDALAAIASSAASADTKLSQLAAIASSAASADTKLSQLAAIASSAASIDTKASDLAQLEQLATIADALRVGLLYTSTSVQPVWNDNGTTYRGAAWQVMRGLITNESPHALWQLDQIRRCTCRTAGIIGGGLPPDPDLAGGCASPWTSSGAEVLEGGRVAATWSGAPAGVTIEGDTDLGRIGGWSGASVWVSSSAPTFSLSPNENEVYPTNQWVTIPGLSAIRVSVAAGYTLTAYLCVPAPEAQCFTITSSAGAGFYQSRFAGIENSWPGATAVAQNTFSDGAFSGPAMSGWTIKLLSFTGEDYIRIYNGGALVGSLFTSQIGQTVPILTNAAPNEFYLVSFFQPFSAEICPPGEG